MVAGRRQVVRELLDPRLVRDGRVGVGPAGRWLGRILAPRSVHLVELLRQGVVRLELVVGDRPGRRDPVVMPQLAEVLLAQTVKGRAVHLRRTADVVVDPGLERLAVRVVPGVGGDVAVVHEDRLGEPVLELARQPAATLEKQDALPRRCEVAGERAAAGTGTDDDHVVIVHASSSATAVQNSSRSSGTMIRAAASISARWEKACGKLPRCRPVPASNSSA